jgi:L-seryl-tRNA(Ser) seleniumtransferase
VDELLSRHDLATLAESAGRLLVVDAIRNVLATVRASFAPNDQSPCAVPSFEELESRIIATVHALLAPSLRPVINATGVILHTNLGRAPLSRQAIVSIAESAGRYSNLEYNVSSGQRGKRDVHTSRLLAELTGAESAIAVNNNAAAVFLVLNTLAKQAEVIVSRGELIEIGDGFRIPDIMSESGAQLREVGTTNRTRIRDYEQAINERTRLLLRVHPSNFRITGFTERASLKDLVELGNGTGVPVYEDLGSGCLAELSANGIDEPVVRASCASGASVISFSGDKLLGGPQAGIIAGKKEIVERIRCNPLFRALRVDKLIIAALEATLQSYRRGTFDEIPALRMIRASAEELKSRAQRFVVRLQLQLSDSAVLEVREGSSVIGGGATPDQQLPTHLISIGSNSHSAAALEKALRSPSAGLPVAARIEEDRVVIDLRTVSAEEEDALAAALIAALSV